MNMIYFCFFWIKKIPTFPLVFIIDRKRDVARGRREKKRREGERRERRERERAERWRVIRRGMKLNPELHV